jgi:hypothetical protein
MNFHTTGSAKVKSMSCCVLFDPKDGNIQHVHRVVTMEGVPETFQADLEAQTVKPAKDLGLDTGNLQMLHVETTALAEPGRYSVDPKSRTLVTQNLKAVGGLPATGGQELKAKS